MGSKDLTGSLLFTSIAFCLCQDYGDDVSVIMTVADNMVQGTINVEISADLFKKFHNCLCDDNTKSCDHVIEDSNGYTVRAERVNQNVRRGHQNTSLSAYYTCDLIRPRKIHCSRLQESWTGSNFVSSTSYRLSNTSCDFDCVGFVWLSDDESLYFEDDTDLDNEDCEHEFYTTSESSATIEVSSSSSTTTTTAAAVAVTDTSEVTVSETSTSEPNVTMPTENPSKSESNLGLIVGVTIGLIVLLILVIFIIILWKRKCGMINSDLFYRRGNNPRTFQDNVNRGASVSPDLLHSVPKSVAEENDIDNKTSISGQYVNYGDNQSPSLLNSPPKPVGKPHAQFHTGYDGNMPFDGYENQIVPPPANSHIDQFKPSSTLSEVDEKPYEKKAAPLPSEKPTQPGSVCSEQKKPDNFSVNMAKKGPKLQTENEMEDSEMTLTFGRINCPEYFNNCENTSIIKATASTFPLAQGIRAINNDYGYSSIDAYYENYATVDDPTIHRSAAAHLEILPGDNIHTDPEDHYERVDTLQEDNTAITNGANRSDNTIYNNLQYHSRE